MKKYLLIALMGFIALPFFAEKVNAQYGAHYGSYLDYALTKRYRHPSTKRKSKRVKPAVKSRKRNAARKVRRISAIENIVEPKFILDSSLPNKSLVV